MTGEKAFRGWQRALERVAHDRRPPQQLAPAFAPDPVADVVADDRRESGDDDHRLDAVELPVVREDPGGDQCGLARQRHPGGFHRDEHEQDEHPVREEEIGHASRV